MFAKTLMRWVQRKKILPPLSDTERQALESGDTWNDAGIFSGNPNFSAILAQPYSKLKPQEQAFLDGPCEELCKMFDSWQVSATRRIPAEAIDFIKKQGFMGLRIPQEYGGKEFSMLAVSTILHKLGPYSVATGTVVTIANSLGAAELIEAYGTQEQKEHYLPKLASGEYVPCFGLTELTAGSDAASIKAEGVVFKDDDGRIMIRLNFRKRFITLAPIANLATIACRLSDPEHLLGQTEGITCILVHKGTPGFVSGDHHLPIGEAFLNGPLVGTDVIVPADNIIGGSAYAGQGWKMLMEQLAGGRAGSLPAGAIGAMKLAAAAAGPYSIVREQFNRQIGHMEGIEEKLAEIAALTYMFDAARVHVCSAIGAGIRPPVASAVLKAYSTEWAQQIVKNGLEVFAGTGVMQGPNNILGRTYASAPVAITVEGANILTRTMIVFGQGATRCHPYALKVMHAIESDDAAVFSQALRGWFKHLFVGMSRTFVHGITRGFTVSVPDVAPGTAGYYRRLGWAAAHFGLLTDLALFALGGKLKARGMLTGRYADALAWMLLGLSTLRRFEAEGRRKEDLPLVHYALKKALGEVQRAFEGIYANFDIPVLGFFMRTAGSLWLRMNRLSLMPSDRDARLAAIALQTNNDQFKRLTEGVFFPQEDRPGLGRLIKAFRLICEADAAAQRIIKAQKNKTLPRGYLPAELTSEARQAGIISEAEEKLLTQARATRLEAVEVDVFSPQQYYRLMAGC